jgi:predicted RND superfamily exporter protein
LRAERFFGWLLRFRVPVLIGGVLCLGGLGYLGRDVKPDFSVEQFFPAWDPARVAYNEFKQVFHKEDSQFALFWAEGRPVDRRAFSAMRRAAQLFEEAGLQDVKWFGNLEVVESYEDEEGETTMRARRLIARDDPDRAYLARELARYRDDKLYRGTLWNRDQSVFVVSGILAPEQNTDPGRRETEGALTERLRQLEAPGRTLTLNGIPVMRARTLKLLARDQLYFLGGGLLLILVLLFLIFRSLTQIFLSLASILPSYLCVVGVMGAAGRPITVLTSILPLILVVIGLSDNIHLLVHYREKRIAGLENRDAIVQTFGERYRSCFFTSLTTAIGFLCLIATAIEIVVDFALFTALGLLVTYACSMVFLPVLLSFYRRREFNDAALRARWIGRLIGGTLRLSRDRRRLVLVAGGLVSLGALALGSRLQTNAYMMDDVDEDHPLIQDTRRVETQGFGLFQINLLLVGTKEVPLHGVEVLRWTERYQAFLDEEPLVFNTLSLADHLKNVRKTLLRGDPAQYRLPSSTAEASQYLLLEDVISEGFTDDFYEPHKQLGQVIAVVRDAGTIPTLPLLERIDRFLRADPPPVKRHHVTGTVKLAQTSYSTILGGLSTSLLLVVGVILLLMILMFRSIKLGLVALVPNLMPLALLFGVIYLAGYDIKPSTVLVFSITFSIAVDDTIHVLGVFRRLSAEGGVNAATIGAAMREVGPAVIFTSLVIGLGFGALALSDFLILKQVGLLTAVALLGALVADLLVLPALLHLIGDSR